MAQEQQEVAPKAKGAPGSAKKKNNKKSQPGRYSQLVVDTIRKLGERNGSSLAKIHSEAKKVSWFDQQNGRTYLKYSIRALVQNDTLLQVRGTGANGSFRLNKKKLEGLPPAEPKKRPPPRAKAPPKSPKKSPKKSKPRAKKKTPSAPKSLTRSPKKKAASGATKKGKKATKPRAKKA